MRHLNPVGGPLEDAPREPPPPERITLRLPAELTRRLDERAAALSRERRVHITRSEVVREVLERELTPAARGVGRCAPIDDFAARSGDDE